MSRFLRHQRQLTPSTIDLHGSRLSLLIHRRDMMELHGGEDEQRGGADGLKSRDWLYLGQAAGDHIVSLQVSMVSGEDDGAMRSLGYTA